MIGQMPAIQKDRSSRSGNTTPRTWSTTGERLLESA